MNLIVDSVQEAAVEYFLVLNADYYINLPDRNAAAAYGRKGCTFRNENPSFFYGKHVFSRGMFHDNCFKIHLCGLPIFETSFLKPVFWLVGL